VTGWRVGYLVAPESLTEELRKMHDFHTVTAPHPFQIALANALDLPDSFYDNLRAEYQARKTILSEAVRSTGMTYYEPGGSYFLCCEYSQLSSEDDTVFYERLLREIPSTAVSLYATISECSPMLPLESFAQGVPCLIGPGSHLFRDHTLLREMLVVEQPYNPGLIADMGVAAVARRGDLLAAYGRYNQEVEVQAREALARFLA